MRIRLFHGYVSIVEGHHFNSVGDLREPQPYPSLLTIASTDIHPDCPVIK